MQGFESITF